MAIRLLSFLLFLSSFSAGFVPRSKSQLFPPTSSNLYPSQLKAKASEEEASSSTTDNSAFATLMRYELKKDLLECADSYKEMQKEMLAAKAVDKENKKKGAKDDKALSASRFASIQVELGDKGEAVIQVAERLSKFNPTKVPNYGWQGYGGGASADSPLDGRWKLRFTSGTDADFPDTPARGKTTTSQVVNATDGTLINTVDFEKGKLAGFRVVVQGKAVSDDEMDLIFNRIILLRRSRFPRLFGRITVLLPSFRFLSALGRIGSRGKYKANRRGPGFQIQYIDSELRMHKTRDGIWFIQTRLPEDDD